MERKILHIDMDAFYAAIEMRDHPQYQNQPVIIAQDPRKNRGRGVVATANYVARQSGVHSAMTAQEALELCPTAIFQPPDFLKYKAVSQAFHKILHEYTDQVEPIAFDEAYLDVTNNKKGIESSLVLARMLQHQIYAELRLTSSVGVSYNKFLAKMGSDYCKPIGITIIKADDVKDFLYPLEIAAFRGVGKKTALKMKELGIQTGADLSQWEELDLIRHFGKMGHVFYQQIRGIDQRKVQGKRQRKSYSSERTYAAGLTTRADVENQLRRQATRVSGRLQLDQRQGKTLVIKVRNQQYETITKRYTQTTYLANDPEELYQHAQRLFSEIELEQLDLRLLGLTVTNLAEKEHENLQLPLWDSV